MGGLYVFHELYENCRVAAHGNELLWRQAGVEKNGGKVWGKRLEKERWRRLLHVQGTVVGRVGRRPLV